MADAKLQRAIRKAVNNAEFVTYGTVGYIPYVRRDAYKEETDEQILSRLMAEHQARQIKKLRK